MSEQQIQFNSMDSTQLSGLLHTGDNNRGAVITHPHPMFGGDMYNNVVEAIQTAYQKKGYWTLRFNFRGVGRSEGRYDNGNAEQQDVLAACRVMEESGVQSVDLAGYSFGTWVNANIADKLAAHSQVMVSPPAAMLAFPPGLNLPALKLVVTGSLDEFAAPKLIERLLSQWNPSAPFEIIGGADHFYWGFTQELEDILTSYI